MSRGSGLLRVKLRRDLTATWPRFALMTVAIAVCLTAFASVLFAWAVSGRETRGAYASTEPASATILLDTPVPASTMAAIVAAAANEPGVLAAAGRTQFNSEIEVNGEARDIPLQVFVAAPDDPMSVARVFGDPAWPAGASQILLGQDSLGLLEAGVGDTVTVTTPDGKRVDLKVAGTVSDPSLAPSPQEQTGRAYLASTVLPGPDGQAAFDQLKLQIGDSGETKPSDDRDQIVTVSADLGRWLEDTYDVTIREIQVPQPYAHPHQWQADALLLSLLGGALASLLLAAVLVANMLNNLFTQQIPQIGILKAIGAPARRVGAFYLAMTLVIGAVATLLALPTAIWLGRVAVRNFMGFLGIEPQSLTPPMWTYVVVLALGLGLPPLLALAPVLRASRLTVRSAIDHHGGTDAGPVSRLSTRLRRLRWLDRGLVMAIRNTTRRPARFFLSAGLLACAGTVFVSGMSLGSGVKAVEEIGNQSVTWDVDVQLKQPAKTAEATRLVEGVPGVTGVDAAIVAPTSVAGTGKIPITRTYPDQGHGRVTISTVPKDAPTFAQPDVTEGRWLEPGETGAVVLNQIVRAKSLDDVKVGDTVQLLINGDATPFKVVGIAIERRGGGTAYVTDDGYRKATGSPADANTLQVTTGSHSEATRQEVADAIATRLSDAGVDVASAASISRREAISSGHLGPVVLILLGIAFPLGILGLIGLASTMSANVLDRTREFGVMHAIGARPKAVRRIIVAEGLLVALASCILAVLPTLGLTAVLGDGLGNLFFSAPLPYRISGFATGLWTTLVLVGSVLSIDAAATRASRITVREALAYL